MGEKAVGEECGRVDDRSGRQRPSVLQDSAVRRPAKAAHAGPPVPVAPRRHVTRSSTWHATQSGGRRVYPAPARQPAWPALLRRCTCVARLQLPKPLQLQTFSTTLLLLPRSLDLVRVPEHARMASSIPPLTAP